MAAAHDAVELVRLGQLGADETEGYVSAALDQFLSAQGPGIAEKLAALVEPAAKKAAEAVRPTIEGLAKEYAPSAFAIVGGLLALSVLLGVWVSKRTYIHHRRAA